MSPGGNQPPNSLTSHLRPPRFNPKSTSQEKSQENDLLLGFPLCWGGFRGPLEQVKAFCVFQLTAPLPCLSVLAAELTVSAQPRVSYFLSPCSPLPPYTGGPVRAMCDTRYISHVLRLQSRIIVLWAILVFLQPLHNSQATNSIARSQNLDSSGKKGRREERIGGFINKESYKFIQAHPPAWGSQKLPRLFIILKQIDDRI